MPNYNPRNERIKRTYFTHMKEAMQYSDQSVDAMAAAIDRFEVFTKFTDFKKFKTQWAIDFKANLAAQVNRRTKEKLSKATLLSTVNALKSFFQWLSRERGYKSRIAFRDADYFNLSRGDTAVAKVHRPPKYPTVEQVRHVISSMPAATPIQRRNRALVAFALLTAARVKAISTLRLKHVDLINRKVIQDPREVETKFRKDFDTVFMPFGDDLFDIVSDWTAYLRNELLWAEDDPLFPATKINVGAHGRFGSIGLDRKAWKTTSPIRAIFKASFCAAGIPYHHPHTLRHTLGHFGGQFCQTPEEFKALSQNIAHNGVLTTLINYGTVSSERQAEIIRGFGKPKASSMRAMLQLSAEEAASLLEARAHQITDTGSSRFVK
jgi:integrase/recombinase XerD